MDWYPVVSAGKKMCVDKNIDILDGVNCLTEVKNIVSRFERMRDEVKMWCYVVKRVENMVCCVE